MDQPKYCDHCNLAFAKEETRYYPKGTDQPVVHLHCISPWKVTDAQRKIRVREKRNKKCSAG